MTEHFMIGALIFIVAQVAFVGYLAYLAHRSSNEMEGLTAALYMEAREALRNDKPFQDPPTS